MADPTSELLAVPLGIPVGAGQAPANAQPGKPYAVLHGGMPQPDGRRLSDDRGGVWRRWRLLIAHDSDSGARIAAERIMRTLDGHRLPSGPLILVDFISDPLYDADDPSNLRWTTTIEITATTPR